MKETRRIHGKNTRSGAPGRVKRWLIGAEGWLSARSWRYLAGPLVAVLCVLVLIMPSAYVVQVPGPTQNVLGEVSGKQVIAVSGAKTYKDSQAVQRQGDDVIAGFRHRSGEKVPGRAWL